MPNRCRQPEAKHRGDFARLVKARNAEGIKVLMTRTYKGVLWSVLVNELDSVDKEWVEGALSGLGGR